MRFAFLPLVLAAASAADFLPPGESARTFKVTDAELTWELVLAEPEIAQPVFINWDERGRMWVCEYRQYPEPAGLKPVSHDEFWRAVYDKVPEPPPRGVRGADRISIHEDTNGDGTYDKHTVFVDGLNLCTALEHGRGGHFVLQPPYLLFYADKNRDDVPDGPPDVLLSGFGIEDTHSIANSLRWGPDGWLYGAHGSTVTSRIFRPGDKEPAMTMMGQGIWRYHPETRRVEVFAEGGGNTFGVEFDAHGRLFSGHNGGDTRGFHYVQGGYLRKGFEKHGQLSNPYAFGYFDAMKSNKTERFTHNFVIYEGGALGEKYEGKVFGIEPLQGRVVLSERVAEGSTFGTRDLGRIVTSTDQWFRPVDIKAGPDGAIYVADFHEPEISHLKHRSGFVAKETGRVWRVRSKVAVASSPVAAMSEPANMKPADWLRAFQSANKWTRQTAQRVFADFLPLNFKNYSRALERSKHTQDRLEFLWMEAALFPRLEFVFHNLKRVHWDQEMLQEYLADALQNADRDPLTSEWVVRLLCDAFEEDAGVGRVGFQPAVPGILPGTSNDENAMKRDTPSAKERKLTGVAPGKIPGAAGYKPTLPDATHSLLVSLSHNDPDIHVRAQLAASARRLPASRCLAIIRELLRRDEDAADPRQPQMLWWAIESKCAADRDAVLTQFSDSTLWDRPIVRDHILERLMRRFAQSGTRAELLACARLLEMSPTPEHSRVLMRGFEAAFQGRSLAGLPDELVAAMARHNVGSVALGVRRGDAEAIATALKTLADSKGDRSRQMEFAQVLGEVKVEGTVPALLGAIERGGNDPLRDAALSALQLYDDPAIADRIIAWLAPKPDGTEGTRHVAVLASRPAWALSLVKAVTDGMIAADEIPPAVVRKLRLHKDEQLAALMTKLWPNTGSPTTEEMEKTIARITAVVQSGEGDPYKGRELYRTACAACHTMFGEGGKIGPDLTAYQRDDLAALLAAIVNPSGEIREGYENTTITTRDGRTLGGFLAEQDDKVLVLRGLDGQTTTLPRADVASQQPGGMSVMPPGLLGALDDVQVRDLFAFLRTTQPLPGRRK